MDSKKKLNLGIYEKAFHSDRSWEEKIKLSKLLGFDFLEISIDESDEKISRLDFSKKDFSNLRNLLIDEGFRIPSLCFSAHRRFPFGSMDTKIRDKSMELMEKALVFADRLGVRVIQLAGYDVYYEKSTEITKELFTTNLLKSVALASSMNITLAIEIMDHPFINSITKYLEYANLTNSPFLKVYPDVGNLAAWPENDVCSELKLGIEKKEIVAIHLKDTLAVSGNFEGKFKKVPFGTGCVDFPFVFECLKELNYQGPFLLEMWGDEFSDEVEEIKKAKEWISLQMIKGGWEC